MAAQQPWRNRIVGYGEVPVASILANDKNWRLHPVAQVDALGGVLTDVGVVQNIVINHRSMLKLGWKQRRVNRWRPCGLGYVRPSPKVMGVQM